jgi:hypothetical protein
MNLPVCCGKTMKPLLETAKFLEVHCNRCNDVVYVKKGTSEKPTMLDD